MQQTTNSNIMKAITVIGAGSWGTAVANVIAHNHPEIVVRMWAYEKDVVRWINTQHMNTEYLPDVELAENIIAYTDMKESVKGTDAVILATPSKVVYDTCTRIRRHIDSKVYFGYLSKGFCRVGSGIYTMSQAIELAIPFLMDKVCAICGPSHAEEVCREYHTALHVASKSKASINFFMNLLLNEYLECIPSEDIIGVDCGSTLKNPAAIAAGIISNLPQCGDNLSGALIAQAHQEMIQLGRCLGAQEQTIMGIAGLGDLVATALSQHSRNRRFGREIAEQITRKGTTIGFFDKLLLRVKPENVLERMSKRMHYLVEGAYAIEPILELADKYNLTMPVYRSLYDVLLDKRDPWLLIETIKNPAKYEILTRRARIKVKERKKGIERMSGLIFKHIVVERLMQQLCSENKKSQVLANKQVYMEFLQQQHLTRHKEYSHELSLYNNFNEAQYEKQLKTLIEYYYDSISDRYVYMFSLLILKLARMFFYLYGLLYRRRITEFFEERISLTGDIKYLKKIVMTANPVYFCNAKDQADSLFVVLALIKFISIPLPRFYVDSRLLENKLLRFLFRLCGGYVVHATRCASVIYRETLLQYMLACVEHGIPVLYSNSMEDESSDELLIQDMIIEGLCDLLHKTTEEIAVIPVGVGHKHYNPATHPVSFLKLFRNVTKVHISRPITLSHFSASDTLSDDTKMMLKVKQRHDIPIYPHYFVAHVLHAAGGSLHIEAIAVEIDSILKLRNLKHRYSVDSIMREGMDFLISNNCVAQSGETVVVHEDKKEAIKYFADYVV